MLRWLGRIVLFLLVVGGAAYYGLIVDSSGPWGGSPYAIDMAEVRKLASSMPGDKVQEIRVETVTHFSFPKTAVVAGDGWDPVDMAVYSYQLVFPGSTGIIDTAMDEASGKIAGVKEFDAAAYTRMHAALGQASFIVITHEHMDHIGGLATSPDLAKLLPATKLTKEQVDSPQYMTPVKWPASALDGYKPLEYDRYTAIAPGVVLIKAPGHTPGSQLVYVQRADGKEYLFLGDVAWGMANIERQRTRARLVSWFFIREDREAVLHELAELKRIRDAEPNLVIVPGHDAENMAKLVAAGAFAGQFK